MSGIENIRFDESIALVNSDERRDIYDPERILNGIERRWYHHSVIVINQQNLKLGNHFHDYQEVFFTPTGGFYFTFVDRDNVKNSATFELIRGSRILIPENMPHVVVGKENSVLLGYGNVQFDPKRLIIPDESVLEALSKNSRKF